MRENKLDREKEAPKTGAKRSQSAIRGRRGEGPSTKLIKFIKEKLDEAGAANAL